MRRERGWWVESETERERRNSRGARSSKAALTVKAALRRQLRSKVPPRAGASPAPHAQSREEIAAAAGGAAQPALESKTCGVCVAAAFSRAQGQAVADATNEAHAVPMRAVPMLGADCTFDEFMRCWNRTRCVLLRPRRTSARHRAASSPQLCECFEPIRKRLRAHQKHIAASFTVESGSGRNSKRPRAVGPSSPAELLGAAEPPGGAWYCSWLVQEAALAAALDKAVPCVRPACLSACPHERATWWFVGSNDSAAALPGRPEHTDAVHHSGTWHYQLEGAKRWSLRPTEELLASAAGERPGRARGKIGGGCSVVCEAGDVLVVSTRDVWHATCIPPQPAGRLSVSYAREFNLSPPPAAAGSSGGGERRGGHDGAPASFTNVDGLFATCFLPQGSLVLTEEDLEPGAELPVSATPNCEVCEDEESGLMCLIARVDIRSGEFLSIANDE